MDAVSCIAHQHEARLHEFTRQRQAEREGAARTFDMQGAQTMTEALFQFGFEYEVVFANEALGIRGTLGPDERAAIALQRKDRKRSGREKMLIGPAAMRQFMRDIADDP